jgi:hypothetical protein
MKLAPEAVAARKERARQSAQRVEARRELSGNASLSGREMATADVMASRAYIDALARRLRAAGVPGALGALRVRAMADLTQGRGSPPHQQLAELIRRLRPAFTVIAAGTCDHTQEEPRYTPSRKLRHLIRARNATCDAPGCHADAAHADLDHTVPWPVGPTEQCNIGPRCRTHHRVKQAPDWHVEQTAPGITRWTLPSGRTHSTTPTRYDA